MTSTFRNCFFGVVFFLMISVSLSCREVAGQETNDAGTQPPNYDPIAVNGEYFKDWEKPELALVFTGPLDGYIEPCGCAGMEQMKGGLSRRADFLNDLHQRNWPIIAIDTGGIVNKFGRQQEMKFQMAVTALQEMKYDVVGLGKNDLRLPAGELLVVTVGTSPQVPSIFTSANIGVFAFDPLYTAPYRVVERNGHKIVVTSIVGQSWLQEIGNIEILTADPVEKLRAIIPQMVKENADYMVLISHASAEETETIAKTFPEFGIIVCADTPSEPPFTPRVKTDGRIQYMIEAGEKGKYAIVLALYDNEQEPIKYQRVALDSRFKNARNVVFLMEAYQKNIKRDLDTKGFAALGIKPVSAQNAELLGQYVGTEKCKSCHEESHRVWRKSTHAKAWQSLAETSIPPRTYDPECISCHVDGWNPQEMYPYLSGFSNEKGKITDHLINVGCESCHGPGERHCNAEIGADEALQDELRAAARLSLEAAPKLCYTCHDLDNSPDFDFDTYWPQIEHKELIDLEELE